MSNKPDTRKLFSKLILAWQYSQYTERAVQRCLTRQMLLNFCKIPRKNAVLESLKLLHSLFSSNINEFIRLVLNFFFFTKRFHKYKKVQNCLQRTKIKKCVMLLLVCVFMLLVLFSTFSAFSACKIFL